MQARENNNTKWTTTEQRSAQALPHQTTTTNTETYAASTQRSTTAGREDIANAETFQNATVEQLATMSEDMSPQMPIGPVGKTVMFDGMSLHIDKLSDSLFVSLTRDMFTGRLNMDSNPSFFPNRFHNLVAEYDFPQYWAEKAK